MRFTSSSSILLLQLAGSALAAPFDTHNQLNKRVPPKADGARAKSVVDAFRTSWAGYAKHAFPHDTLHPLTNSYEDDR